MDILKTFISCCGRSNAAERNRVSHTCNFSYRKEQLSSSDYFSLSRSLREEMGISDNARPAVGFLPTLSELDEELRKQVRPDPVRIAKRTKSLIGACCLRRAVPGAERTALLLPPLLRDLRIAGEPPRSQRGGLSIRYRGTRTSCCHYRRRCRVPARAAGAFGRYTGGAAQGNCCTSSCGARFRLQGLVGARKSFTSAFFSL